MILRGMLSQKCAKLFWLETWKTPWLWWKTTADLMWRTWRPRHLTPPHSAHLSKCVVLKNDKNRLMKQPNSNNNDDMIQTTICDKSMHFFPMQWFKKWTKLMISIVIYSNQKVYSIWHQLHYKVYSLDFHWRKFVMNLS